MCSGKRQHVHRTCRKRGWTLRSNRTYTLQVLQTENHIALTETYPIMTEPGAVRPASLAWTEPAAEPALRLCRLLLCHSIELIHLGVEVALELLSLFPVLVILLPGFSRQLSHLLVEPIRFLPGYTFDGLLGFLTVLFASSSIVANSALRLPCSVMGVA